MPQFTDSYTTTAGSATDTRKIIAAIREVVATADLDSKPESTLGVQSYGGYHPLFITGTYPGEEKIPTFAHPIYISNIRGKNIISTDLRLVLRKDSARNFSERINDRINFDYLVSRTVLDLYWASGKSSEFVTGFVFAAKVFATWISQILRTIGLNPEEVLVAETIALAYYYDLCSDPNSYSHSEANRVDWIVANSAFPEHRVAAIMSDVDKMFRFDDLIKTLKKKIQNFQLEKLSVLLFLQKINNSWYGLNREKVLAVSLEHPPTWTALVYHSLSSRSYKNSLISQIAAKAGKRGDSTSFVTHYQSLFESSLRIEQHGTVIVDMTHESDFNYNVEEMVAQCTNRLPIL